MRLIRSTLLHSALAACVALSSIGSVSALPLSSAAGGIELAAQRGAVHPTIEVRDRSGAVAAGILGGLLLGGIIASQYPRPYYEGYPAYPYYPAYRPYPAGADAIAYCARRFKSYDPYSMTYRGYDGLRHPCP
jgi:hypothetical protein